MEADAPRPDNATAAALAHARHCAAIVQASDDAIVGQALDGTIVSWNPGAERLFGWRAAEVVGRDAGLLLPPVQAGERNLVAACLGGGEPVDQLQTTRCRKDGALIRVSVTVAPLRDEAGRIVGAAQTMRDFTERARVRRMLWLQTHYDTLTGLPMRVLLINTLDDGLQAHPAESMTLLLIDLDRFKQVNDALGHAAGNELLAVIAARLRETVGAAGVLARLNGDEFCVAVAGPPDSAPVLGLVGRLLQVVRMPMTVGPQPVVVTASIGMAAYPQDGARAADLLRQADLAMVDAKHAGRNRAVRYQPRMASAVQHRVRLAADLVRAPPEAQFTLAWQPVVDMPTGRIAKCEALIRWHHPVLGPVSPAEFIPVAEETGAIAEIGQWVIDAALQQSRDWLRRFGPDFQVSVNLSPAQLAAGPLLAEAWTRRLAALGLPGRSLVVEITEGMVLAADDCNDRQLRALRRAGIEIAIDDFGTGYSCLANLGRLEINYLKIDRSFVDTLAPGSRSAVLCRTIVAMAQALGLQVVAEGVETAAQHQMLVAMGCHLGQGYLYGRPVSAAEFERRMAGPR